MRLFLDSASPTDLREAIHLGLAHGLTTNPTILAKEPPHPLGYLGALRELTRVAPSSEFPISIQPPLEELRAFPRETLGKIQGFLQHRALAIKIPVSADNLPLIRALAPAVAINATCIFSAEQALAAITAGARYVSFFWCRMKDATQSCSTIHNPGGSSNPVSEIRSLIDRDKHQVNIICGSIRTPTDALEAFSSGAHIVTTGLPVLRVMAENELSAKSAAGMEEAHVAWEVECRKIAEAGQAPSGPDGQVSAGQAPDPQPV